MRFDLAGKGSRWSHGNSSGDFFFSVVSAASPKTSQHDGDVTVTSFMHAAAVVAVLWGYWCRIFVKNK